METKTKKFDAVAESRKWREASSRELDAMSIEKRLAHLRGVKDRFYAEQEARRQGKAALAAIQEAVRTW